MTDKTARRRVEWAGLGWGIASVVVALIRNRAWATPNITTFATAADQFGSNPIADKGDYILSNWLPMVIQYATGQTAPHQVVRLSLLVWAIAMVAIVVWSARRFGSRAAAAVAVVLALAPVNTTNLEWLGQPDPFTMWFAVALVLTRRPRSTVVAAMLLGMTHPEQGVVIVVTAAIAWHVLEESKRGWRPAARRVAWGALGLGLGRLVVEGYFRMNDIRITAGRWTVLTDKLGGLYTHHTIAPGWMIYATLGPLWVLLAVHVVRGIRSKSWKWSRWAPLTVGLGLGALAMLMTLDQTRVFGVVTVPVVLAGAVQAVKEREYPERWMAAVLVVGALIPGVFTAGRQYGATDLPPEEFVAFIRGDGVPGDNIDAWAFKPFPFKIPGT